ncbi:MAG: sugar phosphate isomerase/epimerase [Ruminococcaceae bacterium]|nr:sugar phosphate isomerase/epimerase [Oscillospiraceae bacterium]
MLKIGISGGCVDLTEENFALMSKAGISAVETPSSPVYQAEVDYKRLKKTAEKYGITLWSCHLPFYPFEEFDISAPNREARENTVKYMGELIKKAADAGIDKFVIHPSGEPIEDSVRAEHLKCAMDSLDKLANIAAEFNACIAVEDLPRTCLGRDINELCQLISANERLRVCFDTNHLLYDDNLEFIKTLGDKIITIHVSDYDFVNERHWLPGEGKNDWGAIYNALKSVNYSGIWMYELRLDAPKTIIRPRELTFNDIYENANCIFQNKQLTPFGVPSGSN